MNIETDFNPKLLRFSEKLELMEDILESINEEGQIDEIRKLVNDKKYDDQPPG